MRSELPSVPQVVTSSQSRDSELHTLEQNELLMTEKEDGHWDSGEKNSPQYKLWENLVWLIRPTDLMKTGAKMASMTWYTWRIQTQRLLRPYPGFSGIKVFGGGGGEPSKCVSWYFILTCSWAKQQIRNKRHLQASVVRRFKIIDSKVQFSLKMKCDFCF